MDLSNLTIPPDLFYSKTPAETWKPKIFKKITPTQIKKKEVRKKRLTLIPRRKSQAKIPELGRIGKVKKSFKKLIKKKKVLKEKVENQNNNNVVKPPTKLEEKLLRKEIQESQELVKKKLFSVDENLIRARKRPKGSNFKFFKSKNVRDEENSSSSDESDEIVPEIRDFSENSSANTSTKKVVLDPIDFDDEPEPELDETVNAIESLLENLEKTPQKTPEKTFTSLDSLIGVLEGREDEKLQQKPKQKTKFKGLGEKQLQIDAGQKNFGLVDCKDCGFSYNTSVPEDEKLHEKHHQAMTSIPKFRGWSSEDAISISDWSEHNGRVIRLTPGHKNMSSEFVTEIIKKMELIFGSQEDHKKFHVYLAVYESKIVGIATVKESVVAKKDGKLKRVALGVQRLFIRPEFRRRGIASILLKTIVMMHQKGELLDLQDDVAFSTPTDEGLKLIQKLIGEDFYVF